MEVCMSKLSFISAFAIVISVLIYNVVSTDKSLNDSNMMLSTTNDNIESQYQNNFDQLITEFQNRQQSDRQQLKLALVQQTKLLKALKKIDARLDSLEVSSEQLMSKTSKRENSENSGSNQANLSKKTKALTMGEADLGNWMDTSLTESDATATSIAFEQASETISENSAIDLDGIECAKRFCRATVSLKSDDPDAIRNLFGHPPFMTEGFTIHDADGRVQVYFTQPGVKLGDLRGEALESIRNM
jgi:hypothetical protein